MSAIKVWKHNGKTVQVWPNGAITIDSGAKYDDYSVFDIADGKYINHSKVEYCERLINLLCEAQRSGHDVHQELDEVFKIYRNEIGI